MLRWIRRLGAAARPDPTSRPAEPAALDDDLLAACPDPVLVVDSDLVVRRLNAAARQAVPGLLEDQPLAFALRAPQVLEAVRLTLTSREGREIEFGQLSAGSPLFLARLRPLGGETSPLGREVALFLQDLSAERRLETMRVDFVANLSHELRTPLASLAGFIDTLQGPARDDPAARERFLAIMADQARRMTRLVEDLLQLSRVELREHLAPSEIVDLGPEVHHMVEIMSAVARERGVAVALDRPDEPLHVLGNRDELLRMVENLVENALRYGGGTPVTVALRRLPNLRMAELTVTDEGPGIASEHLPRLTERFYRVDAAGSRATGGTGLGLAIVKHVVGRHRGRLAIESELGRGTTVRIRLPTARPNEGSPLAG